VKTAAASGVKKRGKTMIDKFKGKNRWLSNFSLAQVELDGVEYPSTEHAYQAAKTLDIVDRIWIRQSVSFGQAKRRGQKVTMREDWDDVKLSVMEDLLRQKFRLPHYKELLMATVDQKLVEGNHWHDAFWGVCSCDKCPPGKNHLGKLLMKIRDGMMAS
jgi:ribA/ribD-fused uncharacterized protein